MQVLSSLRSAKNRHPDCKVVRRRGRIDVICKSNPRFKAVQGRKKSVNSKVSSVAKPRCCSTGLLWRERACKPSPPAGGGGDYLMLLSSASTLCLNACS